MPLSASERAALEAGATGLGVRLAPESMQQLERYVDELRRWIPRVNLVSRRDADGLIGRHVVDSLAAVPLLASTSKDALIADVGSGAGLPGVPLAVALAPRRLILIEPRRKRASFLRAVGRALAPLAIEIREARIEDLAGGDLQGRLAAAVTRAALASDLYLASVRPLLAVGGFAIAYRSEADAGHEGSWPGFAAPEVHRYSIAAARRASCLVRWSRSEAVAGGSPAS